MPYLGNQLEGNYTSFETQTITGDGSTGYTLSNAVTNGKELLVYINNVKQEEGSGKSYTASGTTITFSDAVASTDSCYVVYLGRTSQTVSPPDGSLASYSGNASISGNLLVGKTSQTGTGVGIELEADGTFYVGKTGDVATFNRTTSVDGVIIDFEKQGITVGSIGTASSSIYVGSGDTGLLFLASGDAIRPADVSSGSSTRDNAIDLGSAVARFKDIYLSGGAYIGGTTAANKLDDYEEGTWTAQLTDGSTDVDLSTSAVYTKIGNLVTVSFDKYNVNISSLSTSDLSIKTLPFASNASSHGNKIIHVAGTSSGSNVPVLVYPVSGSTSLALYKAVSSSQNMAQLTSSDLSSSISIRLTLTYFTDA